MGPVLDPVPGSVPVMDPGGSPVPDSEPVLVSVCGLHRCNVPSARGKTIRLRIMDFDVDVNCCCYL